MGVSRARLTERGRGGWSDRGRGWRDGGGGRFINSVWLHRLSPWYSPGNESHTATNAVGDSFP